MRRTQRAVLIAAMLAIAPVLAGCADFDMDKLDVFGLNEKKKLPGDRKPLFPEGVPGVSQGIPPEYMMGNRPPENPDVAAAPIAEAPAKTAAVTPAEEPKAKPKPKRAPRPVAASAPTRVTVQPTAQQQPQAQQAPAPWPEPAPQQQPPAQSSGTAPWPSAPPPGTFSRQ